MRYEILNSNGEIINTINATQEFVESQYPGKWRVVEELVREDRPRTLSKLDFHQRFTFAEQCNITASSDPGVNVIRELYQVAESIDLDHPLTRPSLEYLASKGLLDNGRIEEIMQ